MLRRDYDDSLYKKYVDGQNIVSKFKRQHSLRYDYSEIFSNISMDSHIVDIGCRDAQFVKHLQDLGYKNSYGVDVGKSGIDNAIKTYGKEWSDKHLCLKDIQNGFPFDFNCDFINISHTLEHFVYPEKAMNNMIDHLNDNGYMWIVVPSDLPDTGGKISTLPKGSNYHWIFFENKKGITDFIEGFKGLKVLSIEHHRPKKEKVGEWQVLCRKEK